MDTHGRSTRRFRQLSEHLRAQRLPCWICGQAIDYTIERGMNDPNEFTVDHALSRKGHLDMAEDPANLKPAHRRCNSSKGTGQERTNLGAPSRAW